MVVFLVKLQNIFTMGDKKNKNRDNFVVVGKVFVQCMYIFVCEENSEVRN